MTMREDRHTYTLTELHTQRVERTACVLWRCISFVCIGNIAISTLLNVILQIINKDELMREQHDAHMMRTGLTWWQIIAIGELLEEPSVPELESLGSVGCEFNSSSLLSWLPADIKSSENTRLNLSPSMTSWLLLISGCITHIPSYNSRNDLKFIPRVNDSKSELWDRRTTDSDTRPLLLVACKYSTGPDAPSPSTIDTF